MYLLNKDIFPRLPVLVFILISILFVFESAAQKGSLSSREKELRSLNNSINKTKKEINNLSKKERSTISALNKYQKHISNINKYLRLLDDEISELQDSINYLTNLLGLAYEDKAKVRKQYTDILSASGNLREETPTEMSLTQNPGNEKLLQRYLTKKMSSVYRNRIEMIDVFVDSTKVIVDLLIENTDRQEKLKISKQEKKRSLGRTVSSKRGLLGKLRKNRSSLSKQLKQKQSSAKKLKSIIAKLIKQQAAVNGTIAKKLPIGSLTWPISGRKILRNFGQYTNPETKMVFDNPGLDISCSSGTPVKAASKGKVSLVHWLPGYGSLVIIDHGNNVRTVYANLSSVSVEKGQSVGAGFIIGRSGESLDGEFLHFEVWQGSSRLNPRSYLK